MRPAIYAEPRAIELDEAALVEITGAVREIAEVYTLFILAQMAVEATRR